MATIPDSLDLAPVQGASPADVPQVRPTDFGLGQAAQDAGRTEGIYRRDQMAGVRLQAATDRKAVTPAFQDYTAANTEDLAQMKAGYAPGQGGLVSGFNAQAADRKQRFLSDPSYTPGQRAELENMIDQSNAAMSGNAASHQAAVDALPTAQALEAQQQAGIGTGLTNYAAIMGPGEAALQHGFIAGQTDYPQQVDALARSASSQILATTPAPLQGALALQFEALRRQHFTQAVEFQNTHAYAGVLKTTQDNIDQLTNTVTSNPASYQAAIQNLPQVLSPLAGDVQTQAMREARGGLAQARVLGLIANQQGAAAKAELNSGMYDGDLDPKLKEELEARADADDRAHGPDGIALALQGEQVKAAAEADVASRLANGQPTGAVDLDSMARLLGADKVAEYLTSAKLADQAFAATGSIRQMKTPDVQALAAQPAPSAAALAANPNALQLWQVQTGAAKDELSARQASPADWAMNTGKSASGPGAKGAAVVGQDRGQQLQAAYQDWASSTDPNARAQKAQAFATQMLGAQAQIGTPTSNMQIISGGQAKAIAASIVAAPAEGKLAALSQVGALINSLPPTLRMADGTTVSPQQIMIRQLQAEHVTPIELSAMADYGGDPARLGRVVQALNDPRLKATPASQSTNIRSQVTSRLATWMNTALPLPGAEALSQARIDRSVLVARELMEQGNGQNDAINTAVNDLAGGYQYKDTWRMPTGLANAAVNNWGQGAANQHGRAIDIVGRGAGMVQLQLTADNGALLYAPAGPGPAGARQAIYAAQIQSHGRWVTTQDDSGLSLAVPRPGGTWAQVADKYNRPISLSWADLQGQAEGHPSPFAAPPPNHPIAPNGQPVPATPSYTAFQALSAAVTGQESQGVNGLTSSKGALGKMQVMPQTVQTYAPRLGLPVDYDRARTDPAYNQQIGEAALKDNLQRYGAQGAGIGLALAAYNAGQGRLDGFTDKTGAYHPGWLATIGDPRTGHMSLTDWVARIPFPETRAYVQKVLPSALAHLQAHG